VGWPFASTSARDPMAVSWDGQTLAFVQARRTDAHWAIERVGVLRETGSDTAALAKRLQALGLKGQSVRFMLRPGQYQFLQIDAPAVPDAELRAAARYQLRDMVDSHIDDLTLDVLRVGDGTGKGAGLLFAVAAPTATVRGLMALAQAMQWTADVIDVQETAQRNLQSASARAQQRLERADAALVLGDTGPALLTISAKEELFFTRRIDLPAGFLNLSWDHKATGASGSLNAAEPASDNYLPVAEYVPSGAGTDWASDVPTDAPVVDYSNSGYPTAAEPTAGQSPLEAQRLVVEVQRSIDLWDRSWSQWPLAGLQVSAGERSEALAAWLRTETGLPVQALQLAPTFSGWPALSDADALVALPLLGLLLRDAALPN
jgi:MSHA biogenesis protein MshI